MQLSGGTHANCSGAGPGMKGRMWRVPAETMWRCTARRGMYGDPRAHRKGSGLNPRREGFARTRTPADAQAHANLQKTLTMRTTSLFLLLIH